MISPKILFISTLTAILCVYLYFFGQEKTIEIIQKEYLFILALIPLTFSLFFFKFKLKDCEIQDFNQNNTPTLKTTIIFFLVFQVVDYVSEGGFIEMISQWFLYWIMGLIALLLIENINYFRNYKLYQNI